MRPKGRMLCSLRKDAIAGMESREDPTQQLRSKVWLLHNYTTGKMDESSLTARKKIGAFATAKLQDTDEYLSTLRMMDEPLLSEHERSKPKKLKND